MATDQQAREQVEGVLERSRRARVEVARANAHLLEADKSWSVKGSMGLAAAFFYLRLTGNWKLDTGKMLGFLADLGGLGIAGGEYHGTATFDVSLDELVSGSVFVEVSAAAIVGGGLQATFWRDGKYLGVFVGAGAGIFSQIGFGSGNFSVR